MAAMKPAAGKPGLEEEGSQIHRIRITLTSRNVKNLEKGWFLVSSLVTFSVLLASLKDQCVMSGTFTFLCCVFCSLR